MYAFLAILNDEFIFSRVRGNWLWVYKKKGVNGDGSASEKELTVNSDGF